MRLDSGIVRAVVLVGLAAGPGVQAQTTPPGKDKEKEIVLIHKGKHWVWMSRKDQFDRMKKELEPFYDYADKAFESMEKLWGAPMPKQTYGLLVDPQPGGGFCTGDMAEAHSVTHQATPGIGVAFDAFTREDNGVKGYWGYAILTHEMINLSTGSLVSGGWPVDWWADHVSPFPLMSAVQIEKDLMPKVSEAHAKQLANEKLFTALRDDLGWAMFARTFKEAKEDGIDWGRIGANPSALRTNYVCAYLQIGAKKDLTKYFQGPLKDFSAPMVAEILKARVTWKALSKTDPNRAKSLHEAFLKGEYKTQ